MKLYFSNDFYKQKALNAEKQKYNNNHSVQDAIMLLFEDVEIENLTNLCEEIRKNIRNNISTVELTIEECYNLTQGKSIENKIKFDENIKKIVQISAYNCIENGIPLGNKTIMDGTINTSDWIAHSLFEGKLAGQLAEKSGLDKERAQKLGILHDFGRKQIQTFEHVVKGYETLVDKGWEEEAIGCLTHSFLVGGRCALNDTAENGFYVDDDGIPRWLEDVEKDDLTIFLEHYNFTEYDRILNISDLMATSYGIVSPAERIADIAKRRKKFDPINRSYFLAEFINALAEMQQKLGGKLPEDMTEKVRASKGVTPEEIFKKFEKMSEIFFDEYSKMFTDKNDDVKDKKEMKDIILDTLIKATEHSGNEIKERVLGDKKDVVTKGDIEVGNIIIQNLLSNIENVLLESEEHGKQKNFEGDNEEYYIAIDDIDGSNNLRVGKGVLPYCSMIVVFKKEKDKKEYKYDDIVYAGCIDHVSKKIYYTEKGLGKVSIYDLNKNEISSSKDNIRDDSVLVRTLSTDIISCQRGGEKGYAVSDSEQTNIALIPNVLDGVYQKYASVDSGSSVFEYAMVGSGIRDGYISIRKKQHELPLLYAFCKETGKNMVDANGELYKDKVYDFSGINVTVIAGDQEIIDDCLDLFSRQNEINKKILAVLSSLNKENKENKEKTQKPTDKENR